MSGFQASLGKVLWFVTAVASLAIGLNAFGIDLVATLYLGSFSQLLNYLVGASGLASLAMFFMVDCCK